MWSKTLARAPEPPRSGPSMGTTVVKSEFMRLLRGRGLKGCRRRSRSLRSDLRLWLKSEFRICYVVFLILKAGVLSQKFVYEVSPRSGRKKVAHAVSLVRGREDILHQRVRRFVSWTVVT